jgi:hypothetical protein
MHELGTSMIRMAIALKADISRTLIRVVSNENDMMAMMVVVTCMHVWKEEYRIQAHQSKRTINTSWQ